MSCFFCASGNMDASFLNINTAIVSKNHEKTVTGKLLADACLRHCQTSAMEMTKNCQLFS